jgi:MFS family permease
MRRPFFYGYIILALCFINMVVMRGVNGSFGVYYLALLENFGWSHSDGASIASVNFLIYALTAPFVGFAFDRFGPRILMPLGGALVGVGMLLSGFGDSLQHFYFSFGLITALGQGALGFVGNNALISFWFVRRRATAIGIASMGQGVGALIMVPLTQFLVTQLGWSCDRTGERFLAASRPARCRSTSRRRPSTRDGALRFAHAHVRPAEGLDPPCRILFCSILVHHRWPARAWNRDFHDRHTHCRTFGITRF